MADRTAHLTLSANGMGDDRIVVDGHPLSAVTRLLLTAAAGEAPTLVLELASDAYVVGADGVVVGVSPVGHHVLTQLGWRPPGEDGASGRCGEAAPTLLANQPPAHCALPAGHPGWHRSDAGTEWTERTDRDPTCSALCRDVEQDRDRLAAKRDALAALADDILREFTRHGHPGEPCTRTGWLRDTTVAGWRELLAELTAPPDPPAP